MLGMIMKKINLNGWKMLFFPFVLFFLHQISKYVNILSKCKNLLMDLYLYVASLVAQTVKNLLVMQDTSVWFLGWEDPLEKGMATYSSILAWRIPWTESHPGRLQPMGLQQLTLTPPGILMSRDLPKQLQWSCCSCCRDIGSASIAQLLCIVVPN